MQVLVTKTINPIANAQLDWTSNEIPARGYIPMDIVWNPSVVWSTREIIQFTDNRNFKKDVAIILKSIDKTQTTKTTLRKSLAIKSDQRMATRKFTQKSPSPRMKLQRARLSSSAATNGVNKNKDLSMNGKMHGKNVLGINNQTNGFSNVLISFAAPKMHEKENMKPQSPTNLSKILDSFEFCTPTGKGKLNTSNMDYLASLPTPTTHSEGKNQSYAVASICEKLNEIETIQSTPYKIIDQTTILDNIQTPIDHFEMDNSRYFDNIYDRNQFALQKTPAFNDETSFRFHNTLDMTGRKLNLDTEYKENDNSHVINRTHTLSSPIGLAKLSIIEEEQQSKIEMSETYIKQNEHHLTYNVIENVQVTENLVRDVKLISIPLSKKYLSMKELTESDLSLEQRILKNNQGSMPNLYNLDTVKSIENNRYFYQSIEKDLQETENKLNDSEEHNENIGDTSICSVQSTVSTLSVAFNEHEIQAQSSRLNLHEIGRNKSTKTNLCFIIDKPEKQTIKTNKYLSTSSPTVNKVCSEKSKVFGKTKLSQSIKDISLSVKNRPTVISYANGRTTSNTSLKKRARDENLDSSRKSINKLSPPKRACIQPESPNLSKGQAFRTKTWGGIMPKKFHIPSIPPPRLQLKRHEEERVILYDPEMHMKSK